eukprot:11222989-Lingulodinium_polyedra.AAC.1
METRPQTARTEMGRATVQLETTEDKLRKTSGTDARETRPPPQTSTIAGLAERATAGQTNDLAAEVGAIQQLLAAL